MLVTEVIPKIIQWESVEYAPDFVCQKCGGSGHPLHAENKVSLVGWCDTPNGIMVVFECSKCFERFRYHPQIDRFSMKDFDETVKDYIEVGYYANSEELAEKLSL